MIDPRLSSATKELVRLARVDGPSAAARAKMWAGVSGAVGGVAAGGAAAANGATAGGASAAKMLTIGTLLGTPLTVGLAVTLLHVGALPRSLPGFGVSSTPQHQLPGFGVSSTPQHPGLGVSSTPPKPPNVEVVSAPTGWTPTSTLTLTGASTRIVVSTRAAGPIGAGHPKPSSEAKSEAKAAATKAVRAPAHGDALAREAAFVAEAHAALLHGDPNGALGAIASARAVATPQLVPEELAVEAQALRALGRTDEANANEVTLRLLYPESALAR
jgi:hypothetical protein